MDALFAVVPFVPSGVGQVVKIGNGVDNALDVAKAINKAEDVKDATKLAIIGRKKARVKQTASLITTSVSVFVAFKKYDDLAKGVKKVLQNGATLVQNIGWIFGKLRKGYTIIDIGMPTYVKLRGFYYGSEKIILRLLQTRNLWKLPINYYS